MRYLLLIAFSPALIFLIYDLVFYYRPIYTDECGSICPHLIDFMIYSDVMAFIIFLMGPVLVIYFERFTKETVNKARQAPLFWYVLFFFVTLFFYFFLVYAVFNSFNLFEVFANYDVFYTQNSYGTAWVFLIFNALIFFMLYDIYRSGGNYKKLTLLILVILMVSLTGGRSIIVVLISFLVFIIVVINKRKFKLMHYGFALLLALSVFLGNAMLRSGDSTAYIEEATKYDFNNAFILNDVVDYVSKKGPEYLVSLQDFYYFFIPRSFDADKPISTAETRLVFPEVAERATNYTVGIYANVLINLGYYGFILIPFVLFGASFAYFYCSIVARKNSISFLLLFLSFYSIQLVRGGIINARFLMFIGAICIGCSLWHVVTRKRNEDNYSGQLYFLKDLP